LHAFLVSGSEPDERFTPEPGMEVKYVTGGELNEMIRKGEFKHMIHIGVLAAASLDSIEI